MTSQSSSFPSCTPASRTSKQHWPSSLLILRFLKCFIINFLPLPRTRLVLLELPRIFFFFNISASISSRHESCPSRLRSQTPYPKKCLGTTVTTRCTIIRNVNNPNVFGRAHVRRKEVKSDLHMSHIISSCSGR